MRITPYVLATALLAVFTPIASAQALLRYSWGDDANTVVTNQNWAGPIVYSQNFSVIGLSGKIDRIVVHFEGPEMPYAWWPLRSFGIGPGYSIDGMNCLNTARRVSISGNLPGAQPIPGAQLSAGAHGPILNYPVTYLECIVDISPPLDANPATRYGLMLLDVDLVDASVGYVSGTCPEAERPLCFRVTGAMAHHPDQPANVYFSISHAVEDVITWQDVDEGWDCLSTTPARTRTWGSLKARYR